MSPQEELRRSMKIDNFNRTQREIIYASWMSGKSTFGCCNGIVKNGSYSLNMFPQKFMYHKHNDMLIVCEGGRAYGIVRIRWSRMGRAWWGWQTHAGLLALPSHVIPSVMQQTGPHQMPSGYCHHAFGDLSLWNHESNNVWFMNYLVLGISVWH